MSEQGAMTDQQLTCGDCGQEFNWTAAEQSFYAERGFEPPKRCKECRQANKARREAAKQS